MAWCAQYCRWGGSKTSATQYNVRDTARPPRQYYQAVCPTSIPDDMLESLESGYLTHMPRPAGVRTKNSENAASSHWILDTGKKTRVVADGTGGTVVPAAAGGASAASSDEDARAAASASSDEDARAAVSASSDEDASAAVSASSDEDASAAVSSGDDEWERVDATISVDDAT